MFDYGRGGDNPLYLPHDAATDDLPHNYGRENFLLYAENDLPGAVFPADDDPFAPTASAVDQYRRQTARDLGVSD
jgi:hypothetical protein